MFHLSKCVFALIFSSPLFVIMIFRQMEAVWSCCSWLTPDKADHSGALFLYYDFTLSAPMTDQGCCSGWRRDENTDVCLDGGTDSVINGLKSCEQRRGEGGMYDLPSEGQMGLSWSRSRPLSLGSITLMPPSSSLVHRKFSASCQKHLKETLRRCAVTIQITQAELSRLSKKVIQKGDLSPRRLLMVRITIVMFTYCLCQTQMASALTEVHTIHIELPHNIQIHIQYKNEHRM